MGYNLETVRNTSLSQTISKKNATNLLVAEIKSLTTPD